MALIFRLALFATSKTVCCFTDETFSSPREVATSAAQKLQSGNISAAEGVFTNNFQKFSASPAFQYEYISFMLKIGQYDKILNLKVQGETNKKLVQETKTYKRTVESKNIKEICSLSSISPISLDVNLAMIQSFILENKLGQADNYLKYALKFYPNDQELFMYQSFVNLSFGYLDQAIAYLSLINSHLGRKILDLALKLKEYSKINDPGAKMQYYLHLYKEVFLSKVSSTEAINIFNPLYKLVIESIVKLGCDHQMKVASFASVLKEMDPKIDNVVYFIKALILESRFEEAKKEIDSGKFGEAVKRYLDSFYLLKHKEFQKQIEERERREEQKRQQRRKEQEQKNNFAGFQTKNAGKDFLQYYEILGVDNKATPEKLKMAHRKKVKEAKKNAVKKCKLPNDKKDDELKMINKAFQILSDPQKKQSYDMGIDPETGPQQPSHGNFRGAHESFFFDEETINDVFKSFFGGNQNRRGGRTHQRAQFIFL